MSAQKTIGYVIALIASLVALLAFFVMPYISLGLVGSLTGVQIFTTVIQALQTVSSFPSSSFNPGNNQATYLLLIVLLPIVAVITAIIAGVQLSRGERTGKAGATWLIILGGLTLAGLIGVYIYLASNTPAGSPVSITSLLAVGYWANLLAMIAVIIGGILALRTASPVVSQPPPVWSSSQEQWQPMQPPQQAESWQQPQQQWPPSQPPQSSLQWPPRQPESPSQEWPPTQGSQSSQQWPPSQQQPPWQ